MDGEHMHPGPIHDHDRGLAFDLSTMLSRRRVLLVAAGAGLATLVGCGRSGNGDTAATTVTSASGSGPAASPTTAATTAATAANDCAPIPDETAGPYPGDGSNGPNVLTQSGVVRSDIRSSFGPVSGVATGVPLSVTLVVLDGNGCNARPGAAVYVWHCDMQGRYSLYSQGVTDQNYLRGVQEADANGVVTFKSIFPGAYSGRWPHIHFEVYPSLAAATSAGSKLATSQLALPADACEAVYATSGYEQSARNLSRSSLSSDMVFADGYERQLAALSGDAQSGYAARLPVAV